MTVIWLALALLNPTPAGDDAPPASVRVPIGPGGEIDAAELVARLADAVGLEADRPAGAVRLPVNGLAGALTRTMLKETLGPDVVIDADADALTLRVAPEALTARRDELSRRVADLALRARREASRRARYGMHARQSYRPDDPGRPTICLVHGMNSTAGAFLHLFAPLERAGFGLVIYEYPFNRDLDEMVREFAGDWAEFRDRAGDRRPWIVLTHSMGALLARSYVEGDAYAGDVSRLLMIAPPNRGSSIAEAQSVVQVVDGFNAVGRQAGVMASLGEGLGAAAEDLLPGSAFIKALNARPRRDGVRYHILAGDAGFLTPEARRRLEARLGLLTRGRGLLGGVARLAARDITPSLDELTDGIGDGCVTVASTRLDGVDDHQILHANHVELIRGPLLFPEPGPIACMPWLLKRLGKAD